MNSVGEENPELDITCCTLRYRGRGIFTVALDSFCMGVVDDKSAIGYTIGVQ